MYRELSHNDDMMSFYKTVSSLSELEKDLINIVKLLLEENLLFLSITKNEKEFCCYSY